MKILMVGVDESTKGGMWTVVENYLNDPTFREESNLIYIPTSITGSILKRILFTAHSFIRIIGVFLKDKIDIVHIHMAERGSVYRKSIVLFLAKIFSCKVILHLHGAEFQTWYQQLDKIMKNYVKFVLNHADRVIILGKYWSEFIGSLLIDKEKVVVVYNAVQIPKKNRYNCDATKLLFLGAVDKRKGIIDLLYAIKLVDQYLAKDVILLVYGPISGVPINAYIEELGLKHRVCYKGWLDREDKENVFKEIAINLLPSYNEGLPMTILETMSYGIPNISTNIAAIPEVIDDLNGKIFEPGDINRLAEYIIQLVNETQYRRLLSENAFQTIKHSFSLEEHISQILGMYKELLE